MYKIIDYFTGKTPEELNKSYKTIKDAFLAKNYYLQTNSRDNVIHNNLLLIEKI